MRQAPPLARCSPIFPAVQLRRQPREADGGEALDAGTLTAAALGSCSEVIALIRSAIADELIGRAISSPRNATDDEDDEPVTTVGQGQAWHDGGPRPSLPPAAVASVQFDLEDADGSPPRLAEACTYVTLQSNDGSGACRVVTLQEVLGLLEDAAVATAADDDEEEEEEEDDDDDDAVDDVDDEVAGGSATLPAARHEHAKLAGGPTLLRVKFARLTDRRKKKERRRLRREAEAEAAAVESQARAAAARCEASAERARAKATQNEARLAATEAAVKAATTSTDAAVTAPAAERTATREQAASEAAARVAAAHAHEEELAFEATLQRALEESLRTVTAPIAEPAADPAAGPAVSHAQRVQTLSVASGGAGGGAGGVCWSGGLAAGYSTSVPAVRATGRGADADRLPSALLATSPSPIQAAAPYICPPTAGGETALQVIAVGASRVSGSRTHNALLRHLADGRSPGSVLGCLRTQGSTACRGGRRARARRAAEHAAMRIASEKLEAGVRLRAATEPRPRRLLGCAVHATRTPARRRRSRNVGALGVGSRRPWRFWVVERLVK